MIPVYAELLNDLTDKVNDEKSIEEKISVARELLHEIKINKVTNFFLNNSDRIRIFYSDVDNLKTEVFVNLLSPKTVFNFFNEYLNGMIDYIESSYDERNIEVIKAKSHEFIDKIFTIDEDKIGVLVQSRMDSLNDYIWFKNIGVDIIEDIIEKFEKLENKNINCANLLSSSIVYFSIKFLDLCENNFIEMEKAVKPI